MFFVFFPQECQMRRARGRGSEQSRSWCSPVQPRDLQVTGDRGPRQLLTESRGGTHPSLIAGTAFSWRKSFVAFAVLTVAGIAVSSTYLCASWQLRSRLGTPMSASQL